MQWDLKISFNESFDTGEDICWELDNHSTGFTPSYTQVAGVLTKVLMSMYLESFGIIVQEEGAEDDEE